MVSCGAYLKIGLLYVWGELDSKIVRVVEALLNPEIRLDPAACSDHQLGFGLFDVDDLRLVAEDFDPVHVQRCIRQPFL